MKLSMIISLVCLSICGYSQNKDTTTISDLQVPNSPGFQLLDASPSNIERPTSPKQFALTILNATGSGSAIPKNFAMEFSPYWFTKHTSDNIHQYLSVGGEYYFSGIWRRLSVSITSVYNDSTSGSLLKNTNYISAGLRTNVFTYRTKTDNEIIERLITEKIARLKAVYKEEGIGADPDDDLADLKKDTAYQAVADSIKQMLQTPAIQLDVAAAYSEAFADNNYAASRFNRAAAWATLTIAPSILSSAKGGNLAILGVARIMDDNALTDTVKNVFTQTTCFDWGVSLNYTFHNMSVSAEHLDRKYNGNSALNSQRTVLVIQYKVSNSLYVTGTYGKNFGNVQNLFALLGLNFGFGSSSIATSK